MDKQMTISAFSDELAQVRTKKKEFLDQIERIVPWKEWLAMIQRKFFVLHHYTAWFWSKNETPNFKKIKKTIWK